MNKLKEKYVNWPYNQNGKLPSKAEATIEAHSVEDEMSRTQKKLPCLLFILSFLFFSLCLQQQNLSLHIENDGK